MHGPPKGNESRHHSRQRDHPQERPNFVRMQHAGKIADSIRATRASLPSTLSTAPSHCRIPACRHVRFSFPRELPAIMHRRNTALRARLQPREASRRRISPSRISARFRMQRRIFRQCRPIRREMSHKCRQAHAFSIFCLGRLSAGNLAKQRLPDCQAWIIARGVAFFLGMGLLSPSLVLYCRCGIRRFPATHGSHAKMAILKWATGGSREGGVHLVLQPSGSPHPPRLTWRCLRP